MWQIVSGKSNVPGMQGRKTKPPQTTACTGRVHIGSKHKKYSMRCHFPSFKVSNLLTSRKVSWIDFFSSSDRPVINGSSSNGIIPRLHFKSHSVLRVWVQAKNGNGSAKSPETMFDTADISEIYQQSSDSTNNYSIFVQWISSALNHIICLFGKRKWSDFKWF